MTMLMVMTMVCAYVHVCGMYWLFKRALAEGWCMPAMR